MAQPIRVLLCKLQRGCGTDPRVPSPGQTFDSAVWYSTWEQGKHKAQQQAVTTVTKL